jgi:hypothetical protein
MYEAIPLPVISSGGIILLEDTAKIATALMSREIFLVVGNTGLFNPSAALQFPPLRGGSIPRPLAVPLL